MSRREKLVTHYTGLRMTKSELIEQLADIEAASIEATNHIGGLQVDIERMTEQREELRKRYTAERDEKHRAVDIANGQVLELQKLVEYLRADLDLQRDWRRHLRDQRNEALGIIQGMRNDIDTIADAPSKLDQLLEKLQRNPIGGIRATETDRARS